MKQKLVTYLKNHYSGARTTCVMCGSGAEGIPLMITMLIEHLGLSVVDFRNDAGEQYLTDMHYDEGMKLVHRPLWVHRWNGCFDPKQMIKDLEKYLELSQ
ncbi:MAG: hypothetical protein JWO73_821 [Candidatus Taylorbacteria bacterium]|nr:hypothetical protein [Candidatus Taylorbacteria bacterium]